ncbi:MAG: hypothetical protein ABII22_04465 [Candidatus Micrarchaeota archaeon]
MELLKEHFQNKMETEILKLKTTLVKNFWRDELIKVGSLISNSKKKNLKVLTLTNSRNIEEVSLLTKEYLSSKEFLFAWCNNSTEAYSLASEGKFKDVVEAANFEECFTDCPDHEIFNEFPFCICNLDFTSQDIAANSGRIEKELLSIEKLVQKQIMTGSAKNWLLIYTSIIDDNNVDSQAVKSNSDRISVTGWRGITFTINPRTTSQEEVKRLIDECLAELLKKYNLSSEVKTFTKRINSHEIISKTLLFK